MRYTSWKGQFFGKNYSFIRSFVGFYATPFLRELLTTFTDFLGLFSIFILCIIICYTVNWVRLEGGQEQYFPQNPVVGPSRREGEGFLRVRFVCREDSGLFRTNPWPNSGRMCWLLLDSSIIMHLQKEGCDVWCRKKLVTMISILKSLSNQGSNLQNVFEFFSTMVPPVYLSELEKILQYYLGRLPDDKSAKYFTYSDYTICLFRSIDHFFFFMSGLRFSSPPQPREMSWV